ncbi:MAG: ECF transporter S component [Clostridia bacterium]|nr:ECF transporter S component [Clostridia bacterium]
MTNTKRSLLTTRQLSTVAILAAIAAVLFLIEIPVVLFYKLDLSSLPVLLGAFAMGPVPGTLILLVKALLGLLHTTSQGVGELADFIMGFAMMLPASLIYRRNKTRKGAIIGLAVGTVVATVVAVLTNLYIMIPFYGAAYGMPVEAIVGMGQKVLPAVNSVGRFVLLITAPFNILKWVVISVVTALIYKPLSPILHGRKKSVSEAK